MIFNLFYKLEGLFSAQKHQNIIPIPQIHFKNAAPIVSYVNHNQSARCAN